MHITRINTLILSILIFGLLLRGLNSTFGSPSLYISNDEAIFHYSALNIIASRALVSDSYYTPLGTYLQLPFLGLAFLIMKLQGFGGSFREIELFVLTHEGFFLFVPRLISALFGTLSILVMYKITALLFKNKRSLQFSPSRDSTAGLRMVPILSAFIAATSFSLVHSSHFARPWPAAIFFILLAFYFILKGRSALSFLSSAVSYGFLQIGIFALPLIVMFVRKINIKVVSSFVIFLLSIFIFNKLTAHSSIEDALLKFKSGTLISDILLGKFDFPYSIIRTIQMNSFWYFLKNFLATEPIITIFCIFAFLKSYKSLKLHLRLLIFIGLYASFAALFLYSTLHYLALSIIMLIPFSAYGVYLFVSRFKNLYMQVGVLIVLAVLVSTHSIYWNFIFFKNPTFIQAANWVKENVEETAPIAYTGGRFQIFVPDEESILITQNFNGGFYKRLLNNIEKSSRDNTRKIFYLSNFPGESKEDRLDKLKKFSDVEYVVDYFYDPQDSLYLQNQKRFNVLAEFNPVRNGRVGVLPETLYQASWNFPTSSEKIDFSMYSVDRTGPFFQILKPLF